MIVSYLENGYVKYSINKQHTTFFFLSRRAKRLRSPPHFSSKWHCAFSVHQKFGKFCLGCEWNTTFWFVLMQIFRNKRSIWKGSPFFPVETSQWKFVFHLQISRLSHQSQAFRGIFRALLQLRWRFSLLTPEFTMNYTNAKKCFSRRIVGFPNDCRCGTLPVVWTCLRKASVVSFSILKWLLNLTIAIEYSGNGEHSSSRWFWCRLHQVKGSAAARIFISPSSSKFVRLSSSIDDYNIDILAVVNFHGNSE